jgi:hypothetical protein
MSRVKKTPTLKETDNTPTKNSKVSVLNNSKPKTKTKNKPKVEFIPRVLCFSNIDASIVCPYYFIQNIIKHQSYAEINYIINVFIESKEEEHVYKKILKGFINPSNIRVNFFIKSIANIQDHLIGFANIEHQKYNTFLHIEGSAIYLPEYINYIISQYNHESDIVEIKFENNLNNNTSNTYNYILNNKALDILIKNKQYFVDNGWLSIINQNNLKTKSIRDTDYSYSYISKEIEAKPKEHQSDNQKYLMMEDDFFALCMFEHNFWSSYIYMNKRNHRMYNILNDDHGAFEIQDDKNIKIKWDTWGDEMFYRRNMDGTTYYYSINK